MLRTVVGRTIFEVDVGQIRGLIARHDAVAVDLGTGDGAAVRALAHAEPTTLVIGIDSDTAAMRKTSRRAAAPIRRGGLPNALFVRASAEALPADLAGSTDRVQIVLPWGSLLRALLRPDPAVVGGIRALLRPAGQLSLLVSVQPSDGLELPASETELRALADGYGRLGLRAEEVRLATAADVDLSHSSWAKRLGIPARRSAWVLVFRRAPTIRGS